MQNQNLSSLNIVLLLPLLRRSLILQLIYHFTVETERALFRVREVHPFAVTLLLLMITLSLLYNSLKLLLPIVSSLFQHFFSYEIEFDFMMNLNLNRIYEGKEQHCGDWVECAYHTGGTA